MVEAAGKGAGLADVHGLKRSEGAPQALDDRGAKGPHMPNLGKIRNRDRNFWSSACWYDGIDYVTIGDKRNSRHSGEEAPWARIFFPDANFGRYLASVAERDIDLLLMEEFYISDEFVAWFCSQVGLHGVSPAGAWHSVSDSDGESDLLLRVLEGGRQIGILIENKIAAPEQDLQAERYHLRGISLREQGKLDDHVTVICAPRRYLDALNLESAYQHRVSYEQIAAWFNQQEGRRATWRHHIMMEAIDQGRRGYTMTVNAAITGFHLSYWEYLRRRHPRIQMARPKNRGNNSNWIILKGNNFPKGVHMHHKFDQQVMEIGFANRKIADILAVKSDWPDDIAVVQKGETASLAINIPAVAMNLDLEAQVPAVEKALEAAYRLMQYAALFQAA